MWDSELPTAVQTKQHFDKSICASGNWLFSRSEYSSTYSSNCSKALFYVGTYWSTPQQEVLGSPGCVHIVVFLPMAEGTMKVKGSTVIAVFTAQYMSWCQNKYGNIGEIFLPKNN